MIKIGVVWEARIDWFDGGVIAGEKFIVLVSEREDEFLLLIGEDVKEHAEIFYRVQKQENWTGYSVWGGGKIFLHEGIGVICLYDSSGKFGIYPKAIIGELKNAFPAWHILPYVVELERLPLQEKEKVNG